MNTTRLIGSLAALWVMTAAGSALAAAEYVDPAEGFVASKSREDVRRELIAAKADGTAASCKIDGIDNIGSCDPVATRPSALTRKESPDALTRHRVERPGNLPGTPYGIYFGD